MVKWLLLGVGAAVGYYLYSKRTVTYVNEKGEVVEHEGGLPKGAIVYTDPATGEKRTYVPPTADVEDSPACADGRIMGFLDGQKHVKRTSFDNLKPEEVAFSGDVNIGNDPAFRKCYEDSYEYSNQYNKPKWEGK